jgi:hypothetical protein
MGFVYDAPIPSRFAPPPWDRFGLPNLRLISESNTERAARKATARQLAADAFPAVILHLGRAEAEQLFKKAMKRARLPAKGKRARHDFNVRLLEHYDCMVAAGRIPKRNIVGKLVAWLQANDPDFKQMAPGSHAAHIRRVVKDRKKAETARRVEEILRKMDL